MAKKKKSRRGGARPGSGPKPIAGERMETFSIRATREQIERWSAAAKQAGVSLAKWVRDKLDN